jgi:hypothetical protein
VNDDANRPDPASDDQEKSERDSTRRATDEHEADVQSGRAFEWQVGQDAYERWLDQINGSR